MRNLKILVVEDEVLIAEDIADTLKLFGVEKIELAHDKKSALHLITEFNPDVVLLDIRMESETTGLQLGDELNKKNISFIYITSHSDMAMVTEIVKTKPFAYLSKPLKKADLLANLLLFNERIYNNTTEQNQITIKDNGTTFLLNTNEIKYIKSEGNYITVYSENETFVFRKNIESIFTEINDDKFYKPHRSYIVNLAKIKSYSKKEILIDDVEVPISRLLLNDFLDAVKKIKSH